MESAREYARYLKKSKDGSEYIRKIHGFRDRYSFKTRKYIREALVELVDTPEEERPVWIPLKYIQHLGDEEEAKETSSDRVEDRPPARVQDTRSDTVVDSPPTRVGKKRAMDRVEIYADQYARMLSLVESSPACEIGGDLFGRWKGDVPIVEYVLGPGPEAKGSVTAFFQDAKYLEENGNALATRGVEHIGEWHSHHSLGLAEPSEGDCRTVAKAMRQYNRTHFLLCIGNLSSSSSSPTKKIATVCPFVFRNTGMYKAEWHFMEGYSPEARFEPILSTPHHVSVTVHDEKKQLTSPRTEPTQWHTSVAGQQVLKRILASPTMISNFGQAKMIRSKISHDLELVFGACIIQFPPRFPVQRAMLCTTTATGPLRLSSTTPAEGKTEDPSSPRAPVKMDIRYQPAAGVDPLDMFDLKAFITAVFTASIDLGIRQLEIA